MQDHELRGQLPNQLSSTNEWQVERYNLIILATLCTYVVDSHRNLDLYTDALTLEDNFQPDTSIAVAPFNVVLSKPPGLLKIKPMKKTSEPQGDFKRKWKHWFYDTILQKKTRPGKTQSCYKKGRQTLTWVNISYPERWRSLSPCQKEKQRIPSTLNRTGYERIFQCYESKRQDSSHQTTR